MPLARPHERISDFPLPIKRNIARLRDQGDAAAVTLARSAQVLRSSYAMLAMVGDRIATSQRADPRLSGAVSPSLARAYMAARRLPDARDGAAIDPNTDVAVAYIVDEPAS